MKHFLLKFNHGVEIGARLAYIGHFNRTKDPELYHIIQDELNHKIQLEWMLEYYKEKPSRTIDLAFTGIGNMIQWACKICPIWSLNFVARSMEAFAVFNYVKLSRQYPQFKDMFGCMAMVEENHGRYFNGQA